MDTAQTLAGQRFIIAADHGGVALKDHLIGYFKTKNITNFTDIGVFSTELANFPDQVTKVVAAIKAGEVRWGILICGTGVGMSIAANRHRSIFSVPCHDITTAHFAREHNNANILALGGRVTGPILAEEIFETFANATFIGGRYQHRIDLIDPPVDC